LIFVARRIVKIAQKLEPFDLLRQTTEQQLAMAAPAII
jgi:hypothetical protein